MSKAARILVILGAIVLTTLILGTCSRQSKSRAALAKYKSDLRARGEKLTAEELGFPRPLETNGRLGLFLSNVNMLGGARVHPGFLDLLHVVGAGRARVSWAAGQPLLSSSWDGNTNVTWEDFTEHLNHSADALQGIRDAAQNPPRYFYNDPTNFFNQPQGPFVQLRTAAQYLSGDAIAALHAQDLGRAQADLHALTKLALFHHEDLALVSQMIRSAIAGLGLAVTWEALQAQGWNEESLVALQHDWESVDLTDAIERGMTGERASGEAVFSFMRTAGPAERMRMFRGFGTPPARRTAKDYFEQFVLMPIWRANADEDETLFLEFHQRSLDSIRKARNGDSWQTVKVELGSNFVHLDKALSGPMGDVRHRISAIAIPNIMKATAVVSRNETQRRLTIAAIALERYRLRHGRLPPDLDALVPDFLSAVPLDPMSGKPLRYRRNESGFVMYSVGEDGRDDGGDPSSPRVANELDFWSGKDAVWPAPAP
jgi:hypothetical protein